MNSLAIEALYVASLAIRKMPDINDCSFECDNDSGEIIFSINGDKEHYYVLKIKEECEEDLVA